MMDIHIRKTLTVQKNVGSSHIQYILEMMNTIIFSVSFHHSFNSLLVQLSAVSFGRHIQFSSVPVVSDSLPPHGLQHTRLPYSSPASRACWNSCPSSRWCHPTISSSVVPFCLQSCPASGSSPVSQFSSDGQSIGSFSFSHSNEYSGLMSFRID